MRVDIEFDAEGTTLRGWFYTPDTGVGPFPTVVMAHGITGLKEMYLDDFAEFFSEAGLAALVFDHRNYGASDGTPRHESDPVQQTRDYRHAITYARTRNDVDNDRIGVWGSSFSGGVVLNVGAVDKRISAVVAQVPVTSGYQNILRSVRTDHIAHLRANLDADREARFRGEEPARMPVVSADPNLPAALPQPDAYEFFTTSAKRAAEGLWQNNMTLRTVENLMEFEPGASNAMKRISPTPLLMIIAAGDHAAVADHAFETYQRALEPKKLVVLPCGHFDPYTGDMFPLSAGAARDWFVDHLLTPQTTASMVVSGAIYRNQLVS